MLKKKSQRNGFALIFNIFSFFSFSFFIFFSMPKYTKEKRSCCLELRKPNVHCSIKKKKKTKHKKNNMQLHLTCFSVSLLKQASIRNKKGEREREKKKEIPRCCTKNWLFFYPEPFVCCNS